MQRPVQRPGRLEVASERLLDHHPCTGRAPGRAQTLDNGREQTGWDGEIVQRPGRLTKRCPEPGPRRQIAIIACDVVKPWGESGERRRVELSGLREALPDRSAKGLDLPRRSGDADDRDIEMAALHHGLKRREELLARQVAGGSEEHYRLRGWRRHHWKRYSCC